MKTLWKSEKTFGATVTTVVAIGAAFCASLILSTNPDIFANKPSYIFEIGFAWGFATAIFALHLLPVLVIVYKTNLDLRERGYLIADDQNISVTFNHDGSIHTVFYEDVNYTNDAKYKKFYTFHSDPIYKNPQFHLIHMTSFPDESIAFITERLPSGKVITTVYKK